MDTPSKQPKISSMTHEKEEEMQHDISKLSDQVQQILLSQRVTKSEMEANMDGLKNGLKAYMEGLKDGLKANMEGLKEGLINLLQEMLPNGETVFHETHDEDNRNMNYDFRNSNSGLKTNHIPKIDMRKFDGKDPITRVLQIEKYFDLHDVQLLQKVCIAYLYLELNQFLWYKGIFFS